MSIDLQPSRSPPSYGLESKMPDTATASSTDRAHRRSISWPAVDQLSKSKDLPEEIAEEMEEPNEVGCFSWLICLIPNCIASFFTWIKDLIVSCFEEYIPGSEEDPKKAQAACELHSQPKVRSANEQFHRSIFLMGKVWKAVESAEEERTKQSFNCQCLLLGVITFENRIELPFKSPHFHYFAKNRKELSSNLAGYISCLNIDGAIHNFQIALIYVKNDPLKRNATIEEGHFFSFANGAAEPSMTLTPLNLPAPTENKSRFRQQAKDLSPLLKDYPFLEKAGLEPSDLLLPSALTQIQTKGKLNSRPITKNNLTQLRTSASDLLKRCKGNDTFQSATVMISLKFKNGEGEESAFLFTKENGVKQFREPETMHFADFASTMEEVIERGRLAINQGIKSFVLEYVEVDQASETFAGRAIGYCFNPPDTDIEPPEFFEFPQFKELSFKSLAEYETAGFSIRLAQPAPVEKKEEEEEPLPFIIHDD